eukprot:3850134-Rhodomonas_salina.1
MTRHSSSGLPAGGSGPGRAGSSGSGRGTGGSGRGTGGPSLNCDGALSRLGRLPSSGVERAVAGALGGEKARRERVNSSFARVLADRALESAMRLFRGAPLPFMEAALP